MLSTSSSKDSFHRFITFYAHLLHSSSSFTFFTHLLHSSSSFTFFTHLLHSPSLLTFFTRLLHSPSSLTFFTHLLHSPSSFTFFTLLLTSHISYHCRLGLLPLFFYHDNPVCLSSAGFGNRTRSCGSSSRQCRRIDEFVWERIINKARLINK